MGEREEKGDDLRGEKALGGKGGKDLNRERDLREEKETQREKGP